MGETYTVHYTLDLDGGPQLTPFVRNNITSANIQVQHIYSDGRYTLTFVAPSTETLFAVENPNSGTRKMYLSYLFVQDNNASVVEDEKLTKSFLSNVESELNDLEIDIMNGTVKPKEGQSFNELQWQTILDVQKDYEAETGESSGVSFVKIDHNTDTKD